MIFPSKEQSLKMQESIAVASVKRKQRAKQLNKARALRTRRETLLTPIRYVRPVDNEEAEAFD